VRTGGHGDVETPRPAYLLTIVDRGAAAVVAAGTVSAEAGEALKAEARRRVSAGIFFGHIAYASVIGRRALQP
jgi:hypothetical protein